MSEDAVEPQENLVEQVEQQDQVDVDHEQVAYEKTMVPLSALQKVREKKKEVELELQWERQQRQREQAAHKPAEEDNSRYESATKEDVQNSNAKIRKEIREEMWIEQNPEKYELINERLPSFLKQRPHLARAIEDSRNRYEEAYTLMEALTPRQQQQLKRDAGAPTLTKKEAPNSPGTIPKATAMNSAVDVMSMSDSEFASWRSSMKRKR
jgi:hypothetical protein